MYAQSCPILFDLMDCVACQAPLSMEFSRQEYWVSCHFLFQGIFPTQGLNPGPRIEPISPVSPALAGRFFTLRHLGSPYKDYTCTYIKFILLLCGVPYPQSWKVHCTKSFYIKGLNITDFHIQGDHLNRHIDNLWKISLKLVFSSVQFSHSVVSNSLWPHESQHASPPYPSPTPRVHSHSCPSSQ